MSSSVSTAPRPAARLRPPRWRDPRLLIGLAVVAASMLATWLLVDRAAATVTVWSASERLAPGTRLTEEHLAAVEVKLPQNAERYISAASGPPLGLIVLEPLGEGEIIPARTLGTPEQLSARVVSLQVPGALPPGVETGARVDLWAAERQGASGGEAEPEQVLADVPVVLVDRDTSEFGAQRNARLDLLVDPAELPALMQVLAREAHLTVVAIPER